MNSLKKKRVDISRWYHLGPYFKIKKFQLFENMIFNDII